METTFVPVLDDETIEKEIQRVTMIHPDVSFDTSFAVDESATQDEYLFDFDPIQSDVASQDDLPEVEAMRGACSSGSLTSVRAVFKTCWLERPPDERIDKDMLGASGLCEAIKHDNAIIGSYLLSHVVSMHEGHFALATECRAYSFLQLCMENGWNINTALGRMRPSALSLAFDDAQLTLWFLSHGADPNAVCGIDITPLSIAVREASFDIIRQLFDYGGSVEHGQLLHFAARRTLFDRVKVFEYLLEKGASINEIMFQNCAKSFEQEKLSGLGTPLHSAVENPDIVKLLLSKGADPSIKDSRGQLALERAEYYESSEAIALLRPLSTTRAEPPP